MVVVAGRASTAVGNDGRDKCTAGARNSVALQQDYTGSRRRRRRRRGAETAAAGGEAIRCSLRRFDVDLKKRSPSRLMECPAVYSSSVYNVYSVLQ